MSGEAILIVDDNVVNLKLLRVALTVSRYEVRTAIDAEQALAVLQSFSPRLILMDIQLPGMDGLELTRRLKENSSTKDVIVIAVTAYAMKGDQERMLDAGCDGYLTKPIDTRALPATMARFLEPTP
ncbi:MAG TPA: response regulator [Polyangiaceae bacterium]|jgi:CheY-like chemotaxis protein|nr:response regulator [Polyangiaceae bacterium]